MYIPDVILFIYLYSRNPFIGCLISALTVYCLAPSYGH